MLSRLLKSFWAICVTSKTRQKFTKTLFKPRKLLVRGTSRAAMLQITRSNPQRSSLRRRRKLIANQRVISAKNHLKMQILLKFLRTSLLKIKAQIEENKVISAKPRLAMVNLALQGFHKSELYPVASRNRCTIQEIATTSECKDSVRSGLLEWAHKARRVMTKGASSRITTLTTERGKNP